MLKIILSDGKTDIFDEGPLDLAFDGGRLHVVRPATRRDASDDDDGETLAIYAPDYWQKVDL